MAPHPPGRAKRPRSRRDAYGRRPHPAHRLGRGFLLDCELQPQRFAATLYVRMVVWPNVGAMRRQARRRGHGDMHDALAYCHEWQRWYPCGGRLRRDPKVAEVHLAETRLDVAILSHELLHAAAAWIRREGRDFADMNADGADVHRPADRPEAITEERLAHVHTFLIDQAIAELRRWNLVKWRGLW